MKVGHGGEKSLQAQAKKGSLEGESTYNLELGEHGCFPLKIDQGKLTKEDRGAKLQVIKKKIKGRTPLRFLGKYAGSNLISAQSLYPFDDAIDQTITLPPNRISFSLGSGNRRFESRRTREPFC